MNVYIPSKGPGDWQRLLAEPDKQWQPGFSAQAVAQSWEAANGVPPEINLLFGGNLELLLAIPEHQVHLRGGRRPSQCDVFALLRQGKHTIAMAVEGKVDEPFGPRLVEWLADASDGKRERLEQIRYSLQLADEIPGGLHYQLFHRTAAAVIEAKRFKTDIAAMVVQSFSPTAKWFEAFAEFASYLGVELKPGQLGTIQLENGLHLKIGWATGDQAFREKQTSQQSDLYERDFYAWLQDQAVKLRMRSPNDIDWQNLAEEIESVGRSERKEIRTRLALLIQHLLKWQFQPGRRSESWRITISEQRLWIPSSIEDSPSLKRYPQDVFEVAYADGRRQAIDETGLTAKVFPADPPFSVTEALDGRFWPGEPFEPFEVLRD